MCVCVAKAGPRLLLCLAVCVEVAIADASQTASQENGFRENALDFWHCENGSAKTSQCLSEAAIERNGAALAIRSLLQQNMMNTRSKKAEITGRQLSPDELSLIVVHDLRSEDLAAGLLLPVLIMALLLVAGYVFFMLQKGSNKAGPAAPNRPLAVDPTRRTSPSLPPSVRTVPAMPRPSRLSATPAPSTAARSSQSLVLCPELIVPDKVECTLNIPRLLLVKSNSRLNVTDSKGGAVFRVDFSYVPERDGTRLVMKSPTGDVTFGIASDCSVMTQQGSPTQAAALSVINPKDPSRQYLLQQKARGDFQVSNSAGQLLRLLSVAGGYNAIDDQDQLLAFADPPQREADQVARCGPLVDAGLMVMCFMGIGVLLNDQSRHR